MRMREQEKEKEDEKIQKVKAAHKKRFTEEVKRLIDEIMRPENVAEKAKERRKRDMEEVKQKVKEREDKMRRQRRC
jgi:hypothetical protein